MTDEAEARKNTPVWSGFVNYFPRAIQEVARLSWVGNEQHNPGSKLHWDRSKSGDEKDAMMRHLIAAGTTDTDGVRHSTKTAWRAMASLEKELEAAALVETAPQGTFKVSFDEACDGSYLNALGEMHQQMWGEMHTDDACDGSQFAEQSNEQFLKKNPETSGELGADTIKTHAKPGGWVEGEWIRDDPCPNCAKLQNDIDRHECRTTVYPTAGKFYRYLRNFHHVAHYQRWDAIDNEESK